MPSDGFDGFGGFGGFGGCGEHLALLCGPLNRLNAILSLLHPPRPL